MTGDFPAAHSMDTEWFAVDADGHVGVFATTETGALPLPGDDYYQQSAEYLDLIAAVVPRGGVVHDARGLVPGVHARDGNPPGYGGMLVSLGSLDPLRAALDRGDAEPAVIGSGVAALLLRLDAELVEVWRRLHADGQCRGCRLRNEWFGERVGAELGLFEYECEWALGSWGPPPYELVRVPATPIKLEQLPPAVQEVAIRICLGFRFDEAPVFQPADHLECRVTSGALYASLDGTLHRLPGCYEDEAEEETAAAIAQGFTVDPSPWRALLRPPTPVFPQRRRTR